MKILLINVVCGIKSTGRICTDIAEELEKAGHTVRIAYGREYVPEQYRRFAVRIGNNSDVFFHGLKKMILDGDGEGSKRATAIFLRWVKKFDPDVIHLHNLHGYYINNELLFAYLQESGKKVIWTLHDCSTFTGHCAHFETLGCMRWRDVCGNCPQMGKFPRRIWIDRTEERLSCKKRMYGNMEQLIIATPSKWLANWVGQSFLAKYPNRVIYNGVDKSVFAPIDNDIKTRYHIEDKKMLLGVASTWSARKGLEDFCNLSKMLPADYKIVLVGLSERQKKELPDTMIGITRTDSTKELAQFYTAADVFVNPTYDDNYPTVNIEAIACGTPVVTYDTGGSPESANLFGTTVKKGDIQSLLEKIILYSDIKKDNAIVADRVYSKSDTAMEYIQLYFERI